FISFNVILRFSSIYSIIRHKFVFFILSASIVLIYTILQNCTSYLVLYEACLAFLSTNKTIAECSFSFLNLKLFVLNLKLFILNLKVFSLNLQLFGLNLKLFIPNLKVFSLILKLKKYRRNTSTACMC
ncbi:hypothetical protein C0J52_27094, partial [Blattella germanica]